MNRKRKSADVLSQLGEPLPLPYHADPNVKKEKYDELIPSRNTSADFGIRSRLHSGSDYLRASAIDYRDDEERLPLWRKSRRDNNSDYSIDHVPSPESEQETLIRALEQKLGVLRDRFIMDVLPQNLKALEKIGADLDEILEEREQKLFSEHKIIQELEKYQRASTNSRDNQVWRYALPVAVILMLLLSFLAGHFSYEYCYYIC